MAITVQRWYFILAVAFLALAGPGRGQSITHWSSFKTADGLSEPAFHSVTFTPQGKLIATSLKAPLAAELDGYSISNFPAPPGNLGRIGQSPAGQRWALVPEGLMELNDETWHLRPVREIKEAWPAGIPAKGGLPPFFPVRQGSVLFLVPTGLLEYTEENPDDPRTLVLLRAGQTGIGSYTGMVVARDGGLWISGTHGLVHLAGPVRNLGPKTPVQELIPPAAFLVKNFSQPEPDDNGGLVLLGESKDALQKVMVTLEGTNWAVVPGGLRNFFHAWRGPDQNLWAATPDALFEWVPGRTNWVENEEISASQIADVAVEPGGAFWLATSDGLFRGAPPLWQRPRAVTDLDQPVPSLASGADGGLYFIAGNRLHFLQNTVERTWGLPPVLQNPPVMPALFPLKSGGVLLDVGNSPFQFSADTGAFTPVPLRDQAGARALGLLSDGSVVFYHAGEHPWFDTFDGAQFQPLVNPPVLRENEGLFTTLFAARNGDLWLGGEQAVWWRHNGEWQRFASADNTTPERAVGFAEMPDGKMGCVTPDQLWEFDGANWLLMQTRFNHIHSLVQGRDGRIWLASNGGLVRSSGGVWLYNGVTEGLENGPVYALAENAGGQLWAATAHGLYGFNPAADPDPPKTQVRRMAGEAGRLLEGDPLNLLFDGQDKWKYAAPDRLVYSYQLDQQGWSAFRDLNAFSLPNPAAGRHYFQVRAMDRNGNVDSQPATLDFTVVTPWFRETRLWLVFSLGLAAAVFFAAVAWQRHRQLVKSYAAVEQMVAERTRELEIATRELMHSQKMNALGTLAAGLAHDFNNILSIIKGSAQIIEDNPGNLDKIRVRVDRIKTVVQQGAEIVDAMLGFSRGSDAPAARCDINVVVGDTVKLLGDRFLREAEVQFERTENLPELAVSRDFIQQILINFIFNAAEAMSGRKKITLTTGATSQLPSDLFLSPAVADSYVLISVRDQGSGIAPEIKARIFEPFFTTKALSSRRGTGLGLSMVYELAKKMGAGLAVQSVPMQGSVFTLILPVRPGLVPKSRPSLPAHPVQL